MCVWGGERGTGEGVILGVMRMQRAQRFVRTAQVNDEGMMLACVRCGGVTGEGVMHGQRAHKGVKQTRYFHCPCRTTTTLAPRLRDGWQDGTTNGCSRSTASLTCRGTRSRK